MIIEFLKDVRCFKVLTPFDTSSLSRDRKNLVKVSGLEAFK